MRRSSRILASDSDAHRSRRPDARACRMCASLQLHCGRSPVSGGRRVRERSNRGTRIYMYTYIEKEKERETTGKTNIAKYNLINCRHLRRERWRLIKRLRTSDERLIHHSIRNKKIRRDQRLRLVRNNIIYLMTRKCSKMP